MIFNWSFFVFGLVLAVEAQQGYHRENPANQLSYPSGNQGYGEEEEASSSGDEIPGEPDKDYPVFRDVPETRFDCGQQQFPGYYADTEARCQVYHICQIGGRKDSFLCPNGTIFNQEKVVCDWWFNFDCGEAQRFYSINEVIVRAMEDADRVAAEKRGAEGYRYNSPNDSRYQQQRPNAPQSDFDTVVIEAARSVPDLSQRGGYERQEMSRIGQRTGLRHEDNSKSSQITGANFGKQINDGETMQEPGQQYLPSRIEANKY